MIGVSKKNLRGRAGIAALLVLSSESHYRLLAGKFIAEAQ